MSQVSPPSTRRSILIGAAALSSLPLLAVSGAAKAAGAMPKANVKYQANPKGASQCSNCTYYLAATSPGGVNQCKLVAGPVAATGWCMLYAPAPKHP